MTIDELRAEIENLRAERDAALALAAKVKVALQDEAVLGNGEYDQGLMCGVEDRGFQKDGYEAMRYGYDRALERVHEAIDDLLHLPGLEEGGKIVEDAERYRWLRNAGADMQKYVDNTPPDEWDETIDAARKEKP